MRSGAYVWVECDRCQEIDRSEEIDLTALASSGSWDERNVEGALRRLGWVSRGVDEDICPDCLEEERNQAL